MGACFGFSCSKQIDSQTRDRISLNGNWGLQLDTASVGITADWIGNRCSDSLFLPGTTDEGKKGKYNTDMTETMALSREYIYEGQALYTKTIAIPEGWNGSAVRLCMERTKPSSVWIDGKYAGSNDNISTPQIYELTSFLSPGEHSVAILIDNSSQAVPQQVYGSSHAYSSSTQTNWNGVIGDFYIERLPICGIEDIQLYPDYNRKSVTAHIKLRNPDANPSYPGELSLYAESWNTPKRQKSGTIKVAVDWSQSEQVVELPLGNNAVEWNEFSPALYRIYASLKANGNIDTQQATFGLRDFRVKGKQFVINDKVTFLRGKHDACVFPLIAHTAMDVDSWRHYFQVAKEYGINHYRFHSWCPPEACFEAADMEGVYLQPELPIWGHVDISDTTLCNFLLKEGRNLHRAYSNHASFVMFALGNEMNGEEGLAMLIQTFKKGGRTPSVRFRF